MLGEMDPGSPSKFERPGAPGRDHGESRRSRYAELMILCARIGFNP